MSNKGNRSKSKKLFSNARKVIPGGVNSPVRAFKSVGGDPVFMESAAGSKLYDVDGNEYIDYIGSWGPMICGHSHPDVIEAVSKALAKGSSFGAPTEMEVEMAELIVDGFDSIQMVRMVNSGTEATMSALRVARGYSERVKVIKLDGCYHGHGDSLLVQAGSGVETLGLPDSPGVPAALANLTISIPYNDLGAMESVLEKEGEQVACVIVEPVVGNMGVLPPEPGYLEGLRALCDQYQASLIFDEVMTGFRVAYGGAQELYEVKPDMTTLGKIIGGGLPVGAYGGQVEIMNQVAPAGPVYQAGTLSGNPLAMAAGIATLKLLKQDQVYEKLNQMSARLANGLKEAAWRARIPAVVNRVGSMMTLFFTDNERVKNYMDAKTCDTKRFAQFFNGMLEKGIYMAPSQFEACFVSLAHTEEDIDKTLEAAEDVLKSIK
ncbi:MAG: glutamate-1-semialdehyde 2,1-aminomutase [Nitrospinota bacterium]|nr:glutamate-1-semialdehyde 2,1-aminomutase [Nitrospinota bacterium]MDH5678888.1 glutamate-1-semialdehyde 2,1-aminomutase [Nitrospinota bacterium]